VPTRPPAPALAAALLLLPAAASCIAMNPSVVDPDAWLGGRVAPAGIYGDADGDRTPGGTLLPVLDLRVDPMERLFLVNFRGDPVYEGVELQTFPGAGGVRLLLWRADTVDVYDPPGRTFDEATDRRGIEALVSPRTVTFQRADFDWRFRTTEHGLDAGVRLVDREGREIVVDVVETRGTPQTGALIAPVGAISDDPDYLPLFFLDEFALVKRGGTRVRVEVDGMSRELERMTRLLRGPASYFTRYADRVVIAHWNERREGWLDPVPLDPGAEAVEAGGFTWHLAWRGGRSEVPRAVAHAGGDSLVFRFAPPLPEMTALAPGAALDGRFVIGVNAVEGILAGTYRVAREGDQVTLVFQPLRAWQPPIVRGPSWVSTYRYEAALDLAGPVPLLRGGWTRVEGRR
jgi:hypothetical protein